MNGFFLTTTEIGVFLNQELFSLRPEPALSNVEGRLRGESSESFVDFVRSMVRMSVIVLHR